MKDLKEIFQYINRNIKGVSIAYRKDGVYKRYQDLCSQGYTTESTLYAMFTCPTSKELYYVCIYVPLMNNLAPTDIKTLIEKKIKILDLSLRDKEKLKNPFLNKVIRCMWIINLISKW